MVRSLRPRSSWVLACAGVAAARYISALTSATATSIFRRISFRSRVWPTAANSNPTKVPMPTPIKTNVNSFMASLHPPVLVPTRPVGPRGPPARTRCSGGGPCPPAPDPC